MQSQLLILNIIGSANNSRSPVWGRKIRILKYSTLACIIYHGCCWLGERFLICFPLVGPWEQLFPEMLMESTDCNMASLENLSAVSWRAGLHTRSQDKPLPLRKEMSLERHRSNNSLRIESEFSQQSSVWLSANCITSVSKYLSIYPCLHQFT